MNTVHERGGADWVRCIRCGLTVAELGIAAFWTYVPEIATCSGDKGPDVPAGVWVAYGLDNSYHMSTTVFADELSALRYALANYMHAGFLRFGDSLDKATPTTESAS